MGEGVGTRLDMGVGEEREGGWGRVGVRQGTGDEERFGNQDTDGSRSMRHFFAPMRRCGAAARSMLEQAAAASWGVPLGEVEAVNHELIHPPTNPRIRYSHPPPPAPPPPPPP